MSGFKRLICFAAAFTLMLSFASPAFGAEAEDRADSLGLSAQEELPPEESGEAGEILMPPVQEGPESEESEQTAGQSVQSGGMILPGQGGSDGVQYLTGRRVYDYDAGSLLVANVGDDLSKLDLPPDLACHVEGREAWEVYWCPVEWQYDLADNTSPGRVSIPGILRPGEGYALKDGFSQEVFYTAVILCGEDMQAEALSRIEFSLKQKGYLVALGEEMPEKIQPALAWCYTQQNESYPAQVRWDFSGVDTSTDGAYPVSGRLLLPACLDLPQGETGEYSSVVYVVDPERIDLTAIIKDTDTEIYVEWLYQVPSPADMAVEYAIGDLESGWISDSEHPYISDWGGEFCYGIYDAQSLTIKKDKLSPGTDYYFRIQYSGGISNILHVNPGGESLEEPENLIALESVNSMFYDLKIFPTGTDPAAFGLPDTVWCTYYGRYSIECDVVWDATAIDAAKPGWAYVKGEITPPQGYRIEEGFAVYYPVMLTEDDMAAETLAEVFVREQFFLAGIDAEISDPFTLEDTTGLSLPEEIEYVTQNGLYGAAPVTWDISGVDTSKPGRYLICGSMELPACFALPEHVNLSASFIQVLEPDRIDLSGFKMDNSMNRVGSCHWLYPAEDFEHITLEYAIGDGDWRRATAETDGGEMWVNELPCRYGSNYLTIQFSSLKDGEYCFRLTYQGQTSNVLRIIVDQNTAVDWDIGGDRGGADQGPQKPPDIEQPAPQPGDGSDYDNGDGTPGGQPDNQGTEDSGTKPPSHGGGIGNDDSTGDRPVSEEAAGRFVSIAPDSVPLAQQAGAEGTAPQTAAGASESAPQSGERDSSQDEVIMECSTDNTLSISGLRLKEMLASGEDTVLFEKQGVSVELPAAFFAELELADNSRFTVCIEKGDNAFTLEFFLDDVPLSALPPTAVCAPFTLAGGVNQNALACFDRQGREVSAAVYDPALQIVKVEIRATGSYTIAERTATVLPVSAQMAGGNTADAPIGGAGGDSGGGVLLAFCGIAAAIACSCFVYLRRRRTAEVGGDG